ncbi:MAG: TIGR01212 family radical SAM protein [Bacteroidales bacterium]|jgi:radical SAM protein (TIGR01212 family)|nr:TIGR01212 family radical SAM protein [Bacteroidales bacterium]
MNYNNKMTYPWGDSRPYNSYSSYWKRTCGFRVQKLSVDAGFTCPNRNGMFSLGGCTFCNNDAFNPSYCDNAKPIKQQIVEGISFHKWRYPKAQKYLAYLQAYSNTFDSLDVLKERYAQALDNEGVIGLVIGTRPDCVDAEKLDYLAELNERYHIIMEYGIESCYDRTLARINRHHTFSQTLKAIGETTKRNIRCGGHLIFGLPAESRDDMLKEAEILSSLGLHSLKFHQLQLLKDTPILKEYEANPSEFHLFTFEDYREFIIDFLERLNPQIVIERFCGEVPPRFHSAYNWGTLRNEQIVQSIERTMRERNTYQGKRFTG